VVTVYRSRGAYGGFRLSADCEHAVIAAMRDDVGRRQYTVWRPVRFGSISRTPANLYR
jgi:hypothetical protein